MSPSIDLRHPGNPFCLSHNWSAPLGNWIFHCINFLLILSCQPEGFKEVAISLSRPCVVNFGYHGSADVGWEKGGFFSLVPIQGLFALVLRFTGWLGQ